MLKFIRPFVVGCEVEPSDGPRIRYEGVERRRGEMRIKWASSSQ